MRCLKILTVGAKSKIKQFQCSQTAEQVLQMGIPLQIREYSGDAKLRLVGSTSLRLF
jgi:hypothetical protein